MSARRTALAALGLGAVLAAPAAHAELYYLIVGGLGGQDQYQKQFDDDTKALAAVARKSTGDAARVLVLTGEGATKQALEKSFATLRSKTKAADSLAVFLIGHGSYDGEAYKLNLPGPDITADEFLKLLTGVPAKAQLVVNTTSASGAVLQSWATDGRVVITATRSGAERNATRFAKHWAAALADGSADTNKNGVITAKEAFDYASREVADAFKTAGTLATEHPQIAGDAAARFTVARLQGAAAAPSSPAAAALETEREGIEAKIEDLRARRAQMDNDAYLNALQELLVQLATVQGKIDEAQGAAEMIRRAALAALVALSAARAASGLTIEYALDRAPALVACDRIAYRGEQAEAQACFLKLLAENPDERIKADAARASGDVRAANTFFQGAVKKYPEDAALRARWGELFLATHQNNDAVKLFQESLAIDEGYVPAKLGLAKVAAGRFEDKAAEWANDVIAKSPDSSIEAYLLLARTNLEDGALDDADKKLKSAQELADKHKLTPLEIYALEASLDLLRGKTESQWTKRALALNPRYGDIYSTPAYFYVITRRYREAIELFQRAVEIQPDNYQAHADLGVNLLRENKMQEAQQNLQIAYRGDPFSAPIVNTLRLIDSFDHFVVSTHAPETPPAVAGAPPPAPNPGVILRLQKDEAPVLEPYVLALVNKAIQTYTKRYGFELKEPVVVELYPEHDDFAVRTSGLPGIGLLGVTFGYLVAMDSPTGRADSDFHWGTTLWHEMAHVFTLEATHHLVPRWFSEGVSVYEEWSTGPLKGRHIPLTVMQAIKEDKFLAIVELDRGFIHPQFEAQVIVSYMQAGLVCEYVSSRWGQEGLERMLGEYGAGKDTAGAIQGALKIAPEQFDKDFAVYVQAQLGSVTSVFDKWQETLKSAHAALGEKNWSDAATAAGTAIEMFPDYVDEGSPYLVKARAQRELGETDNATATLQDYRKRGGHDPDALLSLARALQTANREEDSLAVLQDVLMVAPLRPEVHENLGDRLFAAGRAADAVVEYQALLAMNPHELAEAHFKLAKAYFAAQNRPKSREQLLYALEIAPNYREAQQLLLEIVR